MGKSSVINRLLNRKNFARVGAAPGKTTHINYFKIDGAFYLVDLPGYGYAKVSKSERDRWAKLMEGYFADPELMTLGVMIVDSRHKPTADDCTMAQWYREAGCPFLVVANKLDKLKKMRDSRQSPAHPGYPGAGGGGCGHPLLRGKKGRGSRSFSTPSWPAWRAAPQWNDEKPRPPLGAGFPFHCFFPSLRV